MHVRARAWMCIWRFSFKRAWSYSHMLGRHGQYHLGQKITGELVCTSVLPMSDQGNVTIIFLPRDLVLICTQALVMTYGLLRMENRRHSQFLQFW